jgi:O-antigen ligase
MNAARPRNWIHTSVVIVTTLLLIAIIAALGLYLGNTVTGVNWQDAVRLAGLGGVIFVILVNPVLGMFLWIILEPFTRFWYLSLRLPPGIPDLSLARLSLALLIVVWVAQLASGTKRMRRLTLAEVAIALFCLFALPSVVASTRGATYAAQSLFDKFVAPYAVFVLAKNLYDEEKGIVRLGGLLSVVGLYLSFMVFFEQISGQPLFYALGRTTTYTRSLRKIVSLLGNPSYLGTVLGMVAPYTLYRLVRERSPSVKALWGLLFLGSAAASFLCYNRGVWLALAIGFVVMLVLERRYRRLLLPLLLVAALVGLLGWQTLTESALVTERLTNISGVTFRLTMLQASEKMIREHLVFGVGLENFGYYYLQYGGHWETLAYDVPTPHNSYVLVLTTMGLAAAIPYVLVFVSLVMEIAAALRRGRTNPHVDSALLVTGLAVVAIYMTSAATVDIFILPFTSLVFFAIAGTIVGYASSLQTQQTQPHPPQDSDPQTAETEPPAPPSLQSVKA